MNDPQIFHLKKMLWVLQIIHEARRMLWDYLVKCTLYLGFPDNSTTLDDSPPDNYPPDDSPSDNSQP